MQNPERLNILAGILFFIAAAVTFFGGHDKAIALLWLALGATFVALGFQKKKS